MPAVPVNFTQNITKKYNYGWAPTWQNQQNNVCPTKTQISLHIWQVWSGLHHPHEENLGPWLPIKCTTKTDQTGPMPRLIWVSTGRIGHFAGFAAGQLRNQLSFKLLRLTSGGQVFNFDCVSLYDWINSCILSLQESIYKYRKIKEENRASLWDYGTNHIGNQQRLRQACTSAQSH